MLVQVLVEGKAVEGRDRARLARRHRATALALVFSELFQNALEHRRPDGPDRARAADGDVSLAIADDGAGIADAEDDGTGLSIVRAPCATSSGARSS